MGTINPDFSGETVVITGATSGIGRETAIEFANSGATVIIGDIEEQPKDAETPTAELIADNGGKAEFVRTNVSNQREVKTLIDTARDYGGVDVMINNAGVFDGNRITETTEASLDTVLDVNAKGTYFGVKLAAEDMLKRNNPGVILNTASISSDYAQKGQTAYDATKGAIKMITQGAALELAEHDIRVNGVAPGQIATEFVEGLSQEQRQKARQGGHFKPVPLGRAGEPEDVAGAYLFLASDAAEYITGELLYVDGGWQVG